MTTRIKLGNIAKIRSGVTMRGAVKALTEDEFTEVEHPIRLVQMKDLTDSNTLDLKNLYRIDGEKISHKNWLESNDILFRSRGITNTAVHVGEIPRNLAAASPLVVIRVQHDVAYPAYVAWYINHQDVQQQIQRFAVGTSVQNVNISDLRQVKIQLPPLVTQREISAIVSLAEEEQRLMNQLAEKRAQYFKALLDQYIQHSE